MADHHPALLVGYSVALLGWVAIWRVYPALWPYRAAPSFAHPWREVGWSLLMVAAVLALGQGYVHGYRLTAPGALAPFVDALNHLIIFSPLLLLPVVRRQGPETAWLPTNRVWLRLLIGTGLALLAIQAFTLVRAGSDNSITVVPRVYGPANVSFAVQVFCEDVAIAVVFVRVQSAVGGWVSVVVVALLFALAHLPTLLAEGAPVAEIVNLLLDAALGTLILTVVRRSQDVWWFWCVQFAMDMMQFFALPPAPIPAG